MNHSNRYFGTGRLTKSVVAGLFGLMWLLLPDQGQAQAIAAPESRFYYAIENLDNGQVVRRGQTTQAGIPQGDLILAPETRYREWLLQADSGFIGFTDFRTPQSGQRFIIPSISLGMPISPDSDHDGLSDDAEFVVGTSATNPDSDGDGIMDGAAIGLGLDPGAAARTGIVGSAGAPGTAIDICVFNDIAIVAESDRGVTVFNVFNRMNPLIIAQVDTPGLAQRVACSGNLIAVADGAAGLAVIDITDPPAARITHQINLGGTAQAVVSGGGIAYVGLNTSEIAEIDLTGGTVLSRVRLPGPVLDLAIEGDDLFALTAGALHSLTLKDGNLAKVASIATPVDSRRVTVAAGIAYVTYSRGYNTYNIANAAQPALILAGSPTVFWQQLVVNGSGLGLANIGTTGSPDDVSLYDVADPAQDGVFLTTFTTPGRAQALAIYNGLAYVADGQAGLQVINYLSFDASNQPPAITLSASFPILNGTNGLAEEGKLVRVTAQVSDDVQVRNVEFYLDGVKAATDGNVSFEYRFTTPSLSRQPTFRIQARASDTGGNFTWSDLVTVALVPDATPPRVVRTFPTPGAIVGSVNLMVAYFNEPIAQGTLDAASVQLKSAGSNGALGDSDDLMIAGGTMTYRDDLSAVFVDFSTNLEPGLYQVAIGPPLSDLAGNVMTRPYVWQFWILGGQDSDQDGIPDTIELALGLDPAKPDTDGNGVWDGDEDFDHDGLSNKWEVLFSLDPRNSDSDGNAVPDGQEDPDNDRLTNAQELALRTNPTNPDTDGDGWSDEAEVTGQGDPLNRDVGPRLFVGAVPPLNMLVTGAGPLQAVSLGTVIASPPTTVLVTGVGPPENLVLGTVVAQPPTRMLVSGQFPFDPVSVGMVVAEPPLKVLVYGQGTVANLNLGTITATPPVRLLAPGLGMMESINLGTVIAQPPLDLLAPGFEPLEPIILGTTAAQPPVSIQIAPQ